MGHMLKIKNILKKGNCHGDDISDGPCFCN